MTKAVSRKEAVRALWERGILKWKLHPGQLELYEAIEASPKKVITIVSSRRLGKSYVLLVKAVEICLQTPGAIVKYVCPKQGMVKKILRPMMMDILKDCPIDLKPQFKSNDKMFMFPNNSQIQMEGTDNGNHENIRGGNANACFVDEAGFCTELDYVVKSVLLPTTTTTKGKVILVSTPSKSPDHPFVQNYMLPAKYKDELIIKTIHDNPMITPEDIQEIINEYPGGEDNPEYKREYLCDIIVDEESSVVPEFTPQVERECVMEWKRPPYYDFYVAMDPGFRDLTAVLFAYYDFRANKIIIEDEIVINGPKMTTDYLANEIRVKEESLFFDLVTKEPRKPLLRVSDNNLILINDLQVIHSLTFIPTAKDDKMAAINNMRMIIGQKKLIINPKCVNLIRHLKGATWDSSRKKFARSPDNGHYDCIDALNYLLRNMVLSKNPYPAHYDLSGDNFDYHQVKTESAVANAIKKIFNLKSN